MAGPRAGRGRADGAPRRPVRLPPERLRRGLRTHPHSARVAPAGLRLRLLTEEPGAGGRRAERHGGPLPGTLPEPRAATGAPAAASASRWVPGRRGSRMGCSAGKSRSRNRNAATAGPGLRFSCITRCSSRRRARNSAKRVTTRGCASCGRAAPGRWSSAKPHSGRASSPAGGGLRGDAGPLVRVGAGHLLRWSKRPTASSVCLTNPLAARNLVGRPLPPGPRRHILAFAPCHIRLHQPQALPGRGSTSRM